MLFTSKKAAEKPTIIEGEGFHDYARRVIQWKNENKIAAQRSIPFYKRRLNADRIKEYIFKNSTRLIIMSFIAWGFVHLLFNRNETYSIYYSGRYYLQNVNEQIFNEYVYKLPNDYGNRLVAGTIKSYFGRLPESFGNVIIGGYYIIALLSVYLETRKKQRSEGN